MNYFIECGQVVIYYSVPSILDLVCRFSFGLSPVIPIEINSNVAALPAFYSLPSKRFCFVGFKL